MVYCRTPCLLGRPRLSLGASDYTEPEIVKAIKHQSLRANSKIVNAIKHQSLRANSKTAQAILVLQFHILIIYLYNLT